MTNIKKNIKTSNFLKDDYFHLAHCRYVLYHIYDCGEIALKSAIMEMKRVVREGGLVIAVEPVSYESEFYEFEKLFNEVGLTPVSCTIVETEKRYCYRKLQLQSKNSAYQDVGFVGSR